MNIKGMANIGSAMNAARSMGRGTDWAGIGSLAKMGAAAAWSNPTARSAIIGAGAGAVWGMASSDTSVLGGMALGAGLGAGAYKGYGLGKVGVGAYKDALAYGGHRGAASAAGSAMFYNAYQGISGFGGKMSRAVNEITSTLKASG